MVAGNTVALKLTGGDYIIVNLLTDEEIKMFTGEDDEENEADYIAFRFPLKVQNLVNPETGSKTTQFCKWNPYTDDDILTLPKYHILNVSNPKEKLFHAYLEAVQKFFGANVVENDIGDDKVEQLKILALIDEESGEQ